jgi:hypothetical protein
MPTTLNRRSTDTPVSERQKKILDLVDFMQKENLKYSDKIEPVNRQGSRMGLGDMAELILIKYGMIN